MFLSACPLSVLPNKERDHVLYMHMTTVKVADASNERNSVASCMSGRANRNTVIFLKIHHSNFLLIEKVFGIVL